MPAPSTRMVDLRKGYYEAIASLQTGTYKGSGDVIDWTFYDRMSLLSTVVDYDLFTNGIGQVDAVTAARKTFADTNMIGGVIVPTGAKMYVRAIKVIYQASEIRTEAEITSILQVLRQGVLNVSIFGKDTYGRWGLDELIGMPMLVNSVAANTGLLASTGRFVGIFPLNLPLVIASQVQFSLGVTLFAAPSADLDTDTIKVGLNGILERLS